MTSSTSSSERLAWALALLLPVLVIGAAVAALWAPMEEERSPAALAMEERLASTPPQVLILGNSIAEHAVDLPALSKGLGGRSTLSLTVHASPPPTWYAVFKNRVLANGHRPQLVLVIGTLDFFTQVEVRTELQKSALAEQMGQDEPVIAEKSLGQQVGAVPERVRLRRASLREGFIEAGRLFFLRTDGSSPTRANERAQAASVTVFEEDDRSDFSLQRRVIPVVEVERAGKGEGPVAVADGFVPELVALARQAEAQIVFVRAPLPPSSAATAPVRAEVARELVAWLNENGAGYVDLSGLGLGEGAFRDATHLNARGREAFTKALSAELVRMGADKAGALSPAALPLAVDAMERVGEPAPLPTLDPSSARPDGPCRLRFDLPALSGISTNRLLDLEIHNAEPLLVLQDGEPLVRARTRESLAEGCSGSFLHEGKSLWISPRREDAPAEGAILAGLTVELRLDPAPEILTPKGRRWSWVYPGTGLDLRLAEGLDAKGGAILAQVELHELIEGEPAQLLLLDEAGATVASAPLAPVDGGAPTLREARLSAAPIDGPLRLRVHSPENGGTLLLSALAIGAEGEPLSWLIGSDSSTSSLRLIGGKAFAPTYEGQPPVIAPNASPTKGPSPTVAKIWVPGLEGISSAAVFKAVGEHDCSPVRVFEGEEPLPGRGAKCPKLSKGEGEAGDYCHGGKQILLRAADGGDPLAKGRQYRLRLDPEPFCKGMWWLYPGQAAVRELKRKGLLPLKRGATVLKLQARALPGTGEPGQSLRVELQVGEEVLLDSQVALDSLGEEPVSLDLRAPVSAGSPNLRLRLSTPENAPYLLLQQVVLEGSDPTDPPGASP